MHIVIKNMLNDSTFLHNAVPAMKLIIDREKWLRGEGPDDSFLMRERDEKMCCLGFYSIACGLSKEEILEKSQPNDIGSSNYPEHANWIFYGNEVSYDCDKLIHLNDVSGNEERITKIFAKNGVEVEFIN